MGASSIPESLHEPNPLLSPRLSNLITADAGGATRNLISLSDIRRWGGTGTRLLARGRCLCRRFRRVGAAGGHRGWDRRIWGPDMVNFASFPPRLWRELQEIY